MDLTAFTWYGVPLWRSDGKNHFWFACGRDPYSDASTFEVSLMERKESVERAGGALDWRLRRPGPGSSVGTASHRVIWYGERLGKSMGIPSLSGQPVLTSPR